MVPMIKGDRAFYAAYCERINELKVASGYDEKTTPMVHAKVLTRELNATAEGHDVASSKVAKILEMGGLI